MAPAGVSGVSGAAASTTALSLDQLREYLLTWGIPDTRVQQRAERLAKLGVTLQGLVAAAAQPHLDVLVALLIDEGAQRTSVDALDACTIQAGATKAAAGGEPTVLERLQRLELRLPVVLSDQEEDNVYGSMFLLVDDTQGRKTKVTRQAVAAAEALAHGKAVPVYVGSGFFFKQKDLAVTAYHQLTDEQLSNGAKVSVFLPFSDRRKQLEFIGGDKELDVAYLRCTDGDNDQCFLEPKEVNLHRAMAMPLVMFTTHITVSSQFDTEPSFGQRQASITGFFKGGKVFTYNASTYKGDCGCPVLVHNGKVVGMHVGMVNSYQKGSSRSASLDSSGPHDAEAVLACKFPPVPAL